LSDDIKSSNSVAGPAGLGSSSMPDPKAETLPVADVADITEQKPAPIDSTETRSRSSDSLRCRQFGEYRIISEVARGAMGIVYKARHSRLGREVALKVMLTGEHSSEAEISRFTREAKSLARLRHPNIVPIYDIGEVDGRHFFTMDFIEGQTLSQTLKERSLTATEALRIMEQVADAVSAAHSRGVIHRDIKPSNIMLDADGGVHIMDFGLSKSQGAESKHTRDGTTIGTPGYMPPEQALGELSRVDEHSDIYSMGAVLYEMLVGQPPFGGTNLLEIVLAVINEDPARPRTINPRLPRELETIILKCMEKEQGRRYHAATELREEIRRYQGGEPIRAQSPGILYWLRKKLRKHWVAAIIPLAVIIIALIAGAYVMHYRQTMNEEIVEGTIAKWAVVSECQANSEALLKHWTTPQNTIFDSYLSRVSADQKGGWVSGTETLSRTKVYGNSRVTLLFELGAPLASGAIGLGFKGEVLSRTGIREQRASCIFRISEKRVEFVAVLDPDKASRPRVVADRLIPTLYPGRTYRAIAERNGVLLSFKLQEMDTEGKVQTIATLSCAHPQFSNWRYRHLNLVLQQRGDMLRPKKLMVEKLFLPRLTSSLVGADSMFFRGDYDGAYAEYAALVAPESAEGRPRADDERAAAYLRLGMCHEIKGQLQEALNYYEQIRSEFKDVSENPALAAVRSAALFREVITAGHIGNPGRVYSLLTELNRLPAEDLSGPWCWGLVELAGDLAGKQQRGVLAKELIGAVRQTQGSIVVGRNVKDIGWSLVRNGRQTDLVKLVAEWMPRLAPGPEPLLEWAQLCAEAGEVAGCARLLRTAANLLGAGNGELIFCARESCKPFAERRQYSAAVRLIAAAGVKKLQPVFFSLLTGAMKNEVSQALVLLRFASDHWPNDPQIAAQALALANRLVAEGAFARLKNVDDAFHTKTIVEAYLAAVIAQRNPETPISKTLATLREAASRFGSNDVELARIAVEIGADYAACRNDGDYRMVMDAHTAYPSEQHLPNFLLAFENLIRKPGYEGAGELFAYSRSRIGPDPQLADAVRSLLESSLSDEELGAFMGQLAVIETRINGEAADLATWRLELARYYLLAGNEVAAVETYQQIWKGRTAAPIQMIGEAILRQGLTRSLGNNRGDRAEARNILGRLLREKRIKGRSRIIAEAVLARKLVEADFRRLAARSKISPTEVELALAARASLAQQHSARANHLRVAWNQIHAKGATQNWPYELVKFRTAVVLH
jgi:tRNA A-37 threonylcarbamoyl transferase component Bud32